MMMSCYVVCSMIYYVCVCGGGGVKVMIKDMDRPSRGRQMPPRLPVATRNLEIHATLWGATNRPGNSVSCQYQKNIYRRSSRRYRSSVG